MKKVKQFLVERTSKTVDNGIMGFHDYETEYQPYEDFMSKVTNEANNLLAKGYKLLNISYPSLNLAVIVCICKEEKK